MIITPQALRGIYTAFNTVFNKAFEGQHPTYEKVATVVPSTSESETYAWLGDIPGMREWIGEREIQNLSGSAYTIKNKDFELTVGVDRNAVEDDKIGLYNPSIQMKGAYRWRLKHRSRKALPHRSLCRSTSSVSSTRLGVPPTRAYAPRMAGGPVRR